MQLYLEMINQMIFFYSVLYKAKMEHLLYESPRGIQVGGLPLLCSRNRHCAFVWVGAPGSVSLCEGLFWV